MTFIEKHLDLHPPKNQSSWRKIAIGTWRSAKDPSVYGVLELRCEKAMEYIDSLSKSSGQRVTITHFLGKAIAEALRRNPEINSVLRFGKIYSRKNVTLFFQVATDQQGKDLSGVIVRDAENKTLLQMTTEMNKRIASVRDFSDKSYSQMKSLMSLIPGWLTGWVLDIAGFIQYSLNMWSPLLGTPKDPMGSVMITNIGSLGLDLGFAPLVAYSRVPLLITAGAIKQRPVVENGEIVVGTTIPLCVTFDHRIIDGMHASKLSQTMIKIFADPETELNVAEREKTPAPALALTVGAHSRESTLPSPA
ncbi:MAG: 2-oxo acid dehydrogenase subunit E2 [Proteobacteria bacterium]|nr:2-oxo acid dehydrogenase subunit E2 [Pseudomonadota bacterium]